MVLLISFTVVDLDLKTVFIQLTVYRKQISVFFFNHDNSIYYSYLIVLGKSSVFRNNILQNDPIAKFVGSILT